MTSVSKLKLVEKLTLTHAMDNSNLSGINFNFAEKSEFDQNK